MLKTNQKEIKLFEFSWDTNSRKELKIRKNDETSQWFHFARAQHHIAKGKAEEKSQVNKSNTNCSLFCTAKYKDLINLHQPCKLSWYKWTWACIPEYKTAKDLIPEY